MIFSNMFFLGIMGVVGFSLGRFSFRLISQILEKTSLSRHPQWIRALVKFIIFMIVLVSVLCLYALIAKSFGLNTQK